MSQFAAELCHGILTARQASEEALASGHPYEANLHRARLADLMEVAARHGVDTSTVIEPALWRELAEDGAAFAG
ncbi:hypothetical protein HFP15_06275 [Amycolatopsis sp. K13G38]|uniref:Uncharacterized protein n=1 Tax=Amycolatopsis acididurans TaxID=2724524 RepID=A0ABX1IZA9_9PSEU|nr:hypothetical protein [Amycolatopsis acididurans]NKQ52481.1 hypothetical protein [Amycolatopsis acididurans]